MSEIPVMEKERPGNYLPEDKGMLPKEKVMLQSKSSATGLTSHITVVVFPFDQKTNKVWRNRKEIVCDDSLVGIMDGSGIHAQLIFVKFAKVWRNRLLTTNSPSLIEIGNKIIEDKDTIEVVNGGPVIYELTVLDSQNNVLGGDLSFHKAFFLGCEGMEGAQKEDFHTDGFRRAFTSWKIFGWKEMMCKNAVFQITEPCR